MWWDDEDVVVPWWEVRGFSVLAVRGVGVFAVGRGRRWWWRAIHGSFEWSLGQGLWRVELSTKVEGKLIGEKREREKMLKLESGLTVYPFFFLLFFFFVQIHFFFLLPEVAR